MKVGHRGHTRMPMINRIKVLHSIIPSKHLIFNVTLKFVVHASLHWFMLGSRFKSISDFNLCYKVLWPQFLRTELNAGTKWILCANWSKLRETTPTNQKLMSGYLIICMLAPKHPHAYPNIKEVWLVQFDLPLANANINCIRYHCSQGVIKWNNKRNLRAKLKCSQQKEIAGCSLSMHKTTG